MGGLQDAGSILLHDYWRRIFQELGGTIDDTRIGAVTETLRKRFKSGAIATEDDWQRLAALVVAEAHNLRMPLEFLNFEQLRTRHKDFIDGERKLLAKHQTKNPDEWIEHAVSSLTRSTQWLCIQGILHQGYVWRCRTCFHTNWNEIDALRPTLICKICGTNRSAPVDEPTAENSLHLGISLNIFPAIRPRTSRICFALGAI